ncbi:MAG: shikimate dehydrogenase [Bacteroidales bacterium]|nr:shikimate dehydrogenase [Bacteroidales bacterium]
MRLYGLIGRKLGHSFSKRYFEAKFAAENRSDCRYELFELPDISNLRDFICNHPDLQGLNVTIPYKQSVMALLDAVDPEAEQVGAVNTIRVFRDNGNVELVGFNTDVEGFRLSLAGKRIPSRALVLGTGGAAAAVAHVLRQWDVPFRQVSRHPENDEISYLQVSDSVLQDYPFVINCTPSGMYPAVEEKPQLPYEVLTSNSFLYDLVYNPEKTLFLKEGEKRGAQIQNGMEMLRLQAEASWKIWNGAKRTECL